MKLKDLRLALSATPKKLDIRYYLNGLNITKTHVSGSNGHVLCSVMGLNVKGFNNFLSECLR
tara:strand:+ start:728 stop:913 length:186 start_codon:yes stop_codon:yes gene_type:complete